MVSMSMCLIATGEAFSPAALEKVIGFQVAKKHEQGEIGVAGRYKGVEYPSGSCIIEMEDSNELIKFLEASMPLIKKYGVTDSILEITVEYSDQCNFDFTPDWLARVSKLNIPISISCFKTEDSIV